MSSTNESKLNLLFVSKDYYPPYRVDVSVLFGDEMTSRGHVIDWILQSEIECSESYVTNWKSGRVFVGATHTGATRISRVIRLIRGVKNDLKMFKLVRKNQYDFVQVKDKFIAALMAILATRARKTKFIYWLSYPIPEAALYSANEGTARYPVFNRIRGHVQKFILYQIIFRFADHSFVQSEQMKRDIIKQGVSESGMTPVPMGVALEMFPFDINSKERDAFHDNSIKHIVYLGTLMGARRMDFMIRVMKRVHHELPNSKLYLVGGSDDPADIDFLHAEVSRYGLDKTVEITGFLPREKALRYLSGADVCVSPFYPTPILNSTSPTKLVEYMAMGKAVVANDHPDQKQVIAESKAGICVAYDEDEFSSAIIKLCREPEVAMEMGVRGRQYVEEYRDYKILADLVEKKYLELCRNSRM